MGIKQKLGMGVAAGVLGVSLVSGGTYAYFTAGSESETGSVSTATVSFDNKIDTSIKVGNLVPGDGDFNLVDSTDATFGEHGPGHRVMEDLTFKYTGSADAWVLIDQFEYTQENLKDGVLLDKNQLVKEVIGYKIGDTLYSKYTGIYNDSVRAALGLSTNYTHVQLGAGDAVPVKQNDVVTVLIKTGLKIAAENEYQGAKWNLNMSLKATQRDHNPESPTNSAIIWSDEYVTAEAEETAETAEVTESDETVEVSETIN